MNTHNNHNAEHEAAPDTTTPAMEPHTPEAIPSRYCTSTGETQLQENEGLPSDLSQENAASSDDDAASDNMDPSDHQMLTKERNSAHSDEELPFRMAGRNFHQPNIEAALLSCCINKPSTFDKVVNLLQPGQLYLVEHVKIMTAMLHLFNAGQQISKAAVLTFIKSLNDLDEEGLISHVEAISATCFNEKSIKGYIRCLDHASKVRGGGTYCPHDYNEDFAANLLMIRLPRIRCVAQTWYWYEAGIWHEADHHPFRREALFCIHPSHRNSRRVDGVVKYVEAFSQAQRCFSFIGAYCISENEDVLINADNCVVKVDKRGEITSLEHSPDFNFTCKLAAKFDQSASCDLFGTKLEEMLPSRLDRTAFQVFAGSILYPSCKFEACLVAYGSGGCGKSTMAGAITDVLGSDLVCSAGLEDLCTQGSYSLAELKHKMLILGSEVSGSEAVESANFKKLVSGETMNVRRIYGKPEEMKSTSKCMFLSNHIPRFYGGTDAEARRLRILHFGMEPAAKDTDLKEKLSTEQSGILNWMLEGLVQLIRLGGVPHGGENSKLVMSNFTKSNDPVGSFLKERCNFEPLKTIMKRNLFEAFVDWCDDNGISAEKMENYFWKTLFQKHPEVGSKRLTIDGVRQHCVGGISLRGSDDESDQTSAPRLVPRSFPNPALVEKLRGMSDNRATSEAATNSSTDAETPPSVEGEAA